MSGVIRCCYAGPIDPRPSRLTAHALIIAARGTAGPRWFIIPRERVRSPAQLLLYLKKTTRAPGGGEVSRPRASSELYPGWGCITGDPIRIACVVSCRVAPLAQDGRLAVSTASCPPGARFVVAQN